MQISSTFLNLAFCHISPGNHVQCLFEGGLWSHNLIDKDVLIMLNNVKTKLQDCFEKESCIIPTSNGWFYQGQAALDRINQEIKALEDGTHWSFKA